MPGQSNKHTPRKCPWCGKPTENWLICDDCYLEAITEELARRAKVAAAKARRKGKR